MELYKDNYQKKAKPSVAPGKGISFFYQCLSMLVCIIFYANLSSPVLADTLVTNTAIASFSINGTTQQLSDSVQFTKNTTVTPDDVITINKQVNVTNSYLGNTITYTLTVTNPNNHDLNNVSILDTLPAALTYQTGTATLNNTAINSSQISLSGNLLSIVLGNIPANSSWNVSYDVLANSVGTAINRAIARSDSVTSSQTQASVTVAARTPSTIKFLIINENGTDSIIPPTSYNDNQNGGINWQTINNITLADGSTFSLPGSQPIIDAAQYTLPDPVIIELEDLDQNTDPSVRDTVIVTIEIAGTNDKEVLLLTETTPDSGIFRGVILTTSDNASMQNGVLSIQQASNINVSYHDNEDNTDTSANAALVIPDTQIALGKTADKSTATIGELVRYTLTVTNTTNNAIANFNLADTLPLGFRYVPETARLNETLLNNGVTTNGRSLNFALSNMPSGQTWRLEYLTKITSGVQIGKAINVATIHSNNFTSNTARATVIITDDLMRTKNILTGRVYIGCNTGKNSKVVKDARIYNETGRSVLTDKEGFWHMEGVNPGAHVLQLDSDTLPDGYEPIMCQDNTRHAGNAKSQFVNLQAGTLWHVDFHVRKIGGGSDVFQQKNKEEAEKFNPVEHYAGEYLQSATEGFEILWPKNNYVPDIASIKILVKSSPQQKIEVFLNGKAVSPLNYDGSETNKAKTITIRRWLGVDIDINNRNNTLLVIAKDKAGKEIGRKTHNIHFSGEPASAELLEDQSILVADGRTKPVIVLRVKDEHGFPARANTHGYLSLEDSNYQLESLSNIERETLSLSSATISDYRYKISKDGIARIALKPTTQTGEVKLLLKFAKTQSKEIAVWLKPKLRQWIMVGIAEGTVAHKTLSGNMQALRDLNKSDEFYKRGRVAFFAKGKVKGKYLLTVAYDTHKEKNEIGSQLEGNVDPDAWYTVYADNSTNQYEAPSSSKLYLKLEKENFYALFGDYYTGLTVSELASYERVLNGFKSEYKGKRFDYKGFISETSNNHHHEEIPGDGTSGLYHLGHTIIANSESIKIETRDRFHSDRILVNRQLTRYQDYNIDYEAGTIYFKFPVTGRDQNFNPNIIVVDYDSKEDSNKSISAGGRVAMRSLNNKLETGLSVIHEGKNKARDNRLIATDATYKITSDTKIHLEAAQSKTAEGNYKTKHAYIVELQKEIEKMEARLFFKKQDGNFGISSQSSEDGVRKAGAEVSYRLNQKTTLNSEISHQKNLENNNTRQLAEVGIEHRYTQFEVSAGGRHTQEKTADSIIKNNIALLGGKYTTNNGKVTLRSNIEKNIDSKNGSELSPDRAIVGVDLRLKKGFTVFAEHETTDNGEIKTHNSRIGLSKDLWQGAKGETTYTQERTDQGLRNYATLGLNQKIKVSKKINLDFSVDQAMTVSGNKTLNRFNQDEPEIQGTQRDDYTAFTVGLNSNDKEWSWTTRAEYRNGDIEDKINFLAGVIRHLDNGKNLSAEISYYNSKINNGDFDNSLQISLGSAWHPKDKDYVFLNRLDLIRQDKQYSGVDSTDDDIWKAIHNMHYNRKINKKTQFSIHHGIKYISDKNNDTEHSATIDTATVEVRRDINKKWDFGLHGGYLHDWNEDTIETVAGISIGVTPAKNAWVEVGYNVEGFDDDDFDNNNYKRKGPYLSFRYKFDQDSLKARDLPIRRKAKESIKPVENKTVAKEGNSTTTIKKEELKTSSIK